MESPLFSVRSTGRRDHLTIKPLVADLKSHRHARDCRLLAKNGRFTLGQAQERHLGVSGPERATNCDLGTSVDQAEARNVKNRIGLGVSVLSALRTSACARMSRGTKQAMLRRLSTQPRLAPQVGCHGPALQTPPASTPAKKRLHGYDSAQDADAGAAGVPY